MTKILPKNQQSNNYLLSKSDQAKNYLLNEIKSERYSQGACIPSENELSALLGLSRSTVREALSNLVSEGHIERIQGKGTFVTGARGVASGKVSGSKKVKFSSDQYFSFYPSIRTKLKFYTMDYHPVQKEFWLKIIRDFSAMESSVEIIPVFGDEVSPDSLAEDISGYDVLQLAPFQSGIIPDSKILNLKPFLEKDRLDVDKFLSFVQDPCFKNGFIRGLPFTLSFSGILAINKDLTAKAGKTIPERFKSLDHFFRWCSGLTSSLNRNVAQGKVRGTNLQNYSYYVLSEMAKGFFLKGGIDTPALKMHLSKILRYRGKAYSGAYGVENLYEQFVNGDIAVFPGSTLDLMFLKDDVGFSWTIRALPRENSEKYYAVPLINSIPSDSHYKEEAWEFVKYLSSARAQLILAEKQANMPTLEEIAFSDTYLTKDKFRRQTLLDVLEHGEEIKSIKPSDIVRVPRMNVNELWRKLFRENRTNDEILCEVVNLADEINQNEGTATW